MSNAAATTDATFQKDVLQSDVPVLVDFWAAWCAPCRMLAPTIDQIAAELNGRLKVLKLDVDSNPATANQFGIQGIPTVILFQGGEAKASIIGVRSKADMMSEIEKAVGVRA